MDEKSWVFHIGPVWFDGTVTTMILVTCLIVFFLVYAFTRNLSLKPKGKQNVLEYLYDFVVGFTEPNVGSRYMKDYSLFYLCLFLFMVIANNLGLMAKLQTTDGTNLWTSPTANLQFDLALSFGIILMTHIEGIRRRGVKKYLKGFITPSFMTPMNLLEEVTNFLSLALRVFGNIFAGEVMASLLITLSHQALYWYPVAFVTNLVWTAFSVFISCVQAYVFTVLSSMYLGHKINDEEE